MPGAKSLRRTASPPAAGRVSILGTDVGSAEGADQLALLRRIGVMWQQGALFGSQTLLENVEMPLAEHTRLSPAARAEVARAKLGLVGLSEAAGRLPSEVSGGMLKRAGIARALAIAPKMLLMDEPFSALDALTRGALQDEVSRLVTEADQTAFMITHDVDEAILLADRILLMTNGPDARLAEVVVNTLPRPRTRADLHHMPGYHPLRDHIMDFLITRSRTLAGTPPAAHPNQETPSPCCWAASPTTSPAPATSATRWPRAAWR
jgi:nitrate/nitrite transport system ATP-binding protein